jgi:hypothetical protein
VQRTKNNNIYPSGISDNWDIWDMLIEQLKKWNDRLADIDEMPGTGNTSGETLASSNNYAQESG